jgi:RNA polymerase sigma-70 factor (ECF subfamily)
MADELDPETAAGWVAAARARWPSLALDAAGLLAHLARVGCAAPAHPIDACLAAACAAGDAAAIRALEEEVVGRAADAARRVDASPAFRAEIAQRLRVRLLVAEGDAPPRIARYTGEVPLFAWARVIAVRLALNAARDQRAPAREPADLDFASADPEIDYLREKYRAPFAAAFEEALRALEKDDRTILRLHYVDGLNIDGIGRIFGVHRATVARWLVRVRAEVLARARELLAARLGADPEDCDSVLGVLAGEIDLTLSRVLRTTG